MLKPGETFSFWRLVGKPKASRGFKIGMVLRNGHVAQGMGGGLCQMTNPIYWMAIHTDPISDIAESARPTIWMRSTPMDWSQLIASFPKNRGNVPYTKNP